MPVVALFHDPPPIVMLMIFHANNLPQITYQESRNECPKINFGYDRAKLLAKNIKAIRKTAAWTWINSAARKDLS